MSAELCNMHFLILRSGFPNCQSSLIVLGQYFVLFHILVVQKCQEESFSGQVHIFSCASKLRLLLLLKSVF